MARAARSTRTPRVLTDGEPTPEVDRLDGILHPRMNPSLIGHAEAEAALASAFASGRMHHAWLLSGTEGIGKATLAYRLARFALQAGGAGYGASGDASGLFGSDDTPGDLTLEASLEAPSARQVMALSHPGLLVLRRQWDAKRKKFATMITVDEVRRLRGFLSLSTSDGGWRVVIVDRADEMNVNAANALLKALEEPPARCLFLLIASEPGRLPVTVLSRCRRLGMSPLDRTALEDAYRHVAQLSAFDAEGVEDWALLHRLAGGSVRRALLLTREDGLTLYDELIKLLGTLPKLDWPNVQGFAESLAPVAQDTRYTLALDLLGDMIVRLVHAGADGRAEAAAEGEAASREHAIAARVAPPGSLAPWSELWERLARDRAEVRLLNLDRQNFLLSVFQEIEAAALAGAEAA